VPHLDAAYNFARWLTRDERNAEDVVQEASLRAFKFIDSFHGDDGRAWLLGIVRNTYYTWLKRNKVAMLAVPFDEESFDSGELEASGERCASPIDQLLQEKDAKRLVDAALERLPGGVPRGDRAARARGPVVQGDRRHRGHSARNGDVAPRARTQAPAAVPAAGAGVMNMDCTDIRNRLPAYLDQELELPSAMEVDRHLASCEDCKSAYAEQTALRSALRSHATYHNAPSGLAQRIRARVAPKDERKPWFRWHQWFPMGAAVAATALLSWTAAIQYASVGPEELPASA
jgi:mycothiol system anti-sigma-R factor